MINKYEKLNNLNIEYQNELIKFRNLKELEIIKLLDKQYETKQKKKQKLKELKQKLKQQKLKLVKNCLYCLNVFKTNRKDKKYCNISCSNKYKCKQLKQKLNLFKKCLYCFNVFKLNRKDKKYCCIKCKNKHIYINKNGVNK